MSFQRPTAAEIDAKLREDFRRRLRDFGYGTENTDPILAVLFRTLAGQIEKVYSEAEHIRESLLDELIAGLGIAHRMARPSQTVVRLSTEHDPLLMDAGTELLGESPSGERLVFSTDVAIRVSTARLSFVLAYQKGTIRVLPGPELDDEIASARPSQESVPVNLGPLPALFLAVQDLPESHLTDHGFFFDVSPFAPVLQRVLPDENWCLAQPDGSFSAAGVLRPHRANAGTRSLAWLLPEHASLATPEAASVQTPSLPDGFYAGRTFVLPSIASARRKQCTIPRGLGPVLPSLFPAGAGGLFEKPRAWIRIGFPPEIEPFENALSNVLLHTVSASNVECLNQTIHFAKHGTSIPISSESGAPSHLVAPINLLSESGRSYVPEFSSADEPNLGRYAIRNGRILLTPAKRIDHAREAYVNLRLWTTAGTRGNRVVPGSISSLLRTRPAPGLQINNVTSAAGGTDGETQHDTYTRFAHTVLSRERVITREDLLQAVRGFDRRICAPKVDFELLRTTTGLVRMHIVTIQLRAADFVDFEAESRILREDLTAYLAERSLFDTPIQIRLDAAA